MEFNEKQKLRHCIKEHFKNSFTSEDKIIFSKAVCLLLMKQNFYKNAKTVMGYYPLNDEVDTKIILNDILQSGKKLLLPKCDTEKRNISSCIINNLTTDLILGYAGIMEPSTQTSAVDTEIDLILVPGRCFSEKGDRVGRGEGYYDRFLQNNLSATKVGIAFDFQVVKNVLVKEHDITMDYILTEKRILKI